MLVLTRRAGEALMVGGEVTVTVLEIRGNSVRIGVNAPSDINVDREEVFRRKQLERSASGETTNRT